jgi:hypothetical protein
MLNKVPLEPPSSEMISYQCVKPPCEDSGGPRGSQQSVAGLPPLTIFRSCAMSTWARCHALMRVSRQLSSFAMLTLSPDLRWPLAQIIRNMRPDRIC